MNWTISQLERTLPDGVVYTAHWRVTKEQDGKVGTAYGTVSFSAKEPSDPDFVPYEQLTQELLVQWVKNALGEEQVTALETSVQEQINKQLNPTTAAGLPW